VPLLFFFLFPSQSPGHSHRVSMPVRGSLFSNIDRSGAADQSFLFLRNLMPLPIMLEHPSFFESGELHYLRQACTVPFFLLRWEVSACRDRAQCGSPLFSHYKAESASVFIPILFRTKAVEDDRDSFRSPFPFLPTAYGDGRSAWTLRRRFSFFPPSSTEGRTIGASPLSSLFRWRESPHMESAWRTPFFPPSLPLSSARGESTSTFFFFFLPCEDDLQSSLFIPLFFPSPAPQIEVTRIAAFFFERRSG